MDKMKVSLFFVGALLVLGATVGISVMTYVIVSNAKQRQREEDEPLTEARVSMVEPDVNTFCGNCHPTPRPSSFPKSHWFDEVSRGFDFYYASGRTDLDTPNIVEVTDYFKFHAPTEEEFWADLPQAQTPPPNTTLSAKPINVGPLAIENSTSHLNWAALTPDGPLQLIMCDMANGTVGVVDPTQPDAEPRLLAKVRHPAHSEVCDLDGDGLLDLVVADLGSVSATDDLSGSVEWLRATQPDGSYEVIRLAEKIGRTCDVRPGDFDGDGDLDLIVAEFGWQTSGSVFLLLQSKDATGQVEFEKKLLDSRHGTVAVAPIDLNQDGKLDFISLVSQEYERLDVFLNQGDGKFKIENLLLGPEPSYGSSGFELVDMDGDGDLDVLYANGDSFDSTLVKPYHSIQWLENKGELTFEHHHVASMPGVHRAMAGDVDGDGDLDLVGVSFMPKGVEIDRESVQYDSVLLMENLGNDTFKRMTIEAGDYIHPCAQLVDLDGDGDLDLAVGQVGRYSLDGDVANIKVWWNERQTTDATATNSAQAKSTP